jgi:hypothetical protein
MHTRVGTGLKTYMRTAISGIFTVLKLTQGILEVVARSDVRDVLFESRACRIRCRDSKNHSRHWGG